MLKKRLDNEVSMSDTNYNNSSVIEFPKVMLTSKRQHKRQDSDCTKGSFSDEEYEMDDEIIQEDNMVREDLNTRRREAIASHNSYYNLNNHPVMLSDSLNRIFDKKVSELEKQVNFINNGLNPMRSHHNGSNSIHRLNDAVNRIQSGV